MASSFADQIPTVVYVLEKLNPKTVLDVGKGFGKYGFLLHEYVGIDHRKKPDPHRTLAQQSRVAIDAVEVNPSYQWQHISQFYRDVYFGRIEELCDSLPTYDVVLMADVIEHIEKIAALRVVELFLARGSTLLISTPRKFFQQELFESPDERHVSFWTVKDFQKPDRTVLYQKLGAGVIYVVKQGKMAKIRGFGNDFLAKARRLARLTLAEMGR
jgi:2-polyprenyl-3-methyl-5-hydroxy-6-metoxy-1,4-benzoquinol methylase